MTASQTSAEINTLAGKFMRADHVTFYFDAGKDEPMRQEVMTGDEHDLIAAALGATPAAIDSQTHFALLEEHMALKDDIERHLEKITHLEGLVESLRANAEYWRLAAERREARRERSGLDIPEARTLDAPEDTSTTRSPK